MMNFEEFVNFVKAEMPSYLPEGFAGAEIITREVEKNNETLMGLTVKKPEDMIAPTMYINTPYEAYKNGVPIGDIMRDLADVITRSYPDQNLNIEEILNKDYVLSKVEPKLVPLKGNNAFLEDKVYTEFLDMAVIYTVPIPESMVTGYGTVTINKEIFGQLNVTIEELDNAARNNISKDWSLNSIVDIMMESPIYSQMLSEEDIEMMKRENPMNILSNEKKVNGAAQILNKSALAAVSEKMGDEFIIIPSSVHEVIVLPYSVEMDADYLKMMIGEVNENELSPQDKLSDHAYIYSYGEIKVA